MRVSYYHGEALLELKYLIPQKGIFVLQQQGKHPLRAGFIDMLSKKPKYSKNMIQRIGMKRLIGSLEKQNLKLWFLLRKWNQKISPNTILLEFSIITI